MNRLSTKRKIGSLIAVTLGGITTYGSICFYKANNSFYKSYVMPVMHVMDGESAHKFAVFICKHRLLPRSNYIDPDLLKTELFNKKILNPIGIAAGFDKHGEAVMGMQDIGFGFVEIGSVTPNPQSGNDRPRVFRLKTDEAVINRYGFNSDGHDVVFNRLENVKSKDDLKVILGVNLGKNKEADGFEDYINGIKKFGAVADYLVINISSPNTPGLRDMQAKSTLINLLKSLIKTRNELPIANKPPLLLKLAPDLNQEQKLDIADVLKMNECKVDGLIISNTTTDRPESLRSKEKIEDGGLSGKPLKNMSTQMIADMYKLTDGMTIIGVGGVSSGNDAYEKIKAGASAVQLYTSFVYEGPPIVEKVKRELTELLKLDNHKNIAEAVGKDVK